ncbi:MAG TPA: outer membrane beta-barrel protein [Xanthobacteraceae bacterium]|jgi:outer membrane immunogenic protein|nr:outer membrane beta-barrel protein [Xanthobacteraceae bacterium]
MNAVLTYAADTPLTRRTCATKGIWAAAIAALSAMAFAVASDAFAADVPLPGPGRPLPPSPVAAPIPSPIPFYYNWTGFYFGANVGAARERTTITDDFFNVSSANSGSGSIFGGQAGYNWQISPQFLVGVEWMFDVADITSNTAVTVPLLPPTTITFDEKIDWIQTLAARFGWAVNNWLFYGKAGRGWVHDTATLTFVMPPIRVVQPASDTASGFMVGAGIEYGFSPSWSAKLEWDHIGLGDVTHPSIFANDTITVSRQVDLLAVGLNYRFSGW